MDAHLVAMLVTWLAFGTPDQKRHAAARLAIGDAPAEPPALVPLGDSLRAVQLGFRRCFYSSHEGCGCTGTHCYRHARVVGLSDCISCLSEHT